MKVPGIVLTLLVLCLPAKVFAGGQYFSIKTRPGVTQGILVFTPKNPVAVAVLFAGGEGRIGLTEDGSIGPTNNFLVRSRQLFVQQRLITVLIDAPSDRQGAGGLLGFRDSKKHAQDIAAVVRFLRKRFKQKPVWLVGTSRGSSSVANAAIRNQGQGSRANAIALTSSVTVDNAKGTSLFEMSLKKIKAPTLVVHHKQDGCKVTPYYGARRIVGRLKKVSVKALQTVTGGDPGGNPCKGLSHHGFLGQENAVVTNISNWLKQHGQ